MFKESYFDEMKCCITLIYIYSFDILLIVFYSVEIISNPSTTQQWQQQQ